MNIHQKKLRYPPKYGRIMLRVAALQFLEFHYGNKWFDPELIEEDDDFIDFEKFKPRSAPRLSDEDIED